jgi:pyruvate/2-oxoglutarate dehydrogenase complex dihydrolipoamide acyltransferase (E2) component
MPSKNLATLSFNTFLFLVSHAVVAATIAAAFFGTGFLLLTHSWEEIKPAAETVNQPAPAETIAAAANQPAPPDTAAAGTDRPVPAAMPNAMRPNYPAPPNPMAMPANPDLIAAFARAAANKGITLQQYRDGRLRFLRQQQEQLQLQLTKPNLSAAETRRLERQKAYWGRAIEQTLALLGNF